MKTNNKTLNQGGATVYETPTLTALDCQGEGLLCQSDLYDRADVNYGFNDMGEI